MKKYLMLIIIFLVSSNFHKVKSLAEIKHMFGYGVKPENDTHRDEHRTRQQVYDGRTVDTVAFWTTVEQSRQSH